MGFLVSLGTILLAPIVSMLALVSFTNWITATIFTSGIVLSAFLFLRFHNKHHRSEAYDDRLTDTRMREAQEYILGRWKTANVED